MSPTIQRYILRDLLRSFALASLVLGLVLGLGFILDPIRDYGIAPAAVPRLVLYTLPITLTMVVPIAALLAATLTYGRLASTNELTACYSSGIGLGELVLPSMALAVLVSIMTLMLGFHVIPEYAKKSEALLTRDAEGILFRNIQRKGDFGDNFRNYRVHADGAFRDQHMLTGVAVLQLDHGEIVRILTANQVLVDISNDPATQLSEVVLRLYDATLVDLVAQMEGRLKAHAISIPIPGMFEDNIEFKKYSELRRIRRHPRRFRPVNELFQQVSTQIRAERFLLWSQQRLQQQGQLVFRSRDGRELVGIVAVGCQSRVPDDEMDWKHLYRHQEMVLLPPAGETVQVWAGPSDDPEQARVHYQARQAQLMIRPSADGPYLLLQLQDTQKRYANDPREYSIEREAPIALAWPEVPFLQPEQSPSLETLRSEAAVPERYHAVDETAATLPGIPQPSFYLRYRLGSLLRACSELEAEIEAELHSRLAFAASCLALVLLGTALGIVFRSGHLLIAFGVSFIPAALCLITVFTGKHIAEKSGVTGSNGILFLWSGIALIMVINSVIYWKLLKR